MPTSIQVLSTALFVLACAPGGDEHLDRMAEEHAGDSPVTSPLAADPGDDADDDTAPGTTSRTVTYAGLDGNPIEGYLATPEGSEPEAAVLVIHEWWGLNDNIRSMADKLAAEGWAALAVDLYEGQAADDPGRARELATAARDDAERVRDNLRQAHAYLTETLGAERVGVIGWCFGGGWSLQTALMLGNAIDAAVVYYGRVVTDPAELEPLTAPLLGIFGAEDDGIPVESVQAFRAALDEIGKEATVTIYQGADHAFANPSGTRYDAAAAEDAWAKTVAFFHRHLDG